MPLFRAATPAQVRVVPLDDLTLVYHRPAGATHLLAEPAREILAALQQAPGDLTDLVARFELGDDETSVLTERLEELVATGLVERV